MTIQTDVHTHILPSMDDGSKSVDQSIAMLREEVRQGIRTVVLTPHFYAYENSPREFIHRRYKSWKMLLPYLDHTMPRILVGAEVQYFEGISRVEEISDLCISHTNLLLLEMPFSHWSEIMIQELLALNRRENMRVLMAHVDRYFSMQPKSVWKRLHDQNVLMHLNAEALLNRQTKHMAKQLLSSGMIQFMASDCHNMTTRPPNLSQVDSMVSRYADSFLEI